MVMPFGLSNAPSSFQAEMNELFRPMLRRGLLVFFDDILIYSTDWPHHLRLLKEVLCIVKSNSFYAKFSKCDIGRTQVSYLGHIISASGVEVDPDKIAIVKGWMKPRNIKQL